MKYVLMALMMTGAVAAVPAAAVAEERDGWRPHYEESDRAWNYSQRAGGDYQTFSRKIARLADWAERGREEGVFDRASARRFSRAADNLQSVLDAYYSRDGKIERAVCAYLDIHIADLRDLMRSTAETASWHQGRDRWESGSYRRQY